MWTQIRKMIKSYIGNPTLNGGIQPNVIQTQAVSPIVATPIVILAGDTVAANMSSKIDENVVAINDLAIQNSAAIEDIKNILDTLKKIGIMEY